MNTYIRFNGKYTAACENEKAALEFLEDHFRQERVAGETARRVLSDVRDWFSESGEQIATHSVKVDGSSFIVVSRVEKQDFGIERKRFLRG